MYKGTPPNHRVISNEGRHLLGTIQYVHRDSVTDDLVGYVGPRSYPKPCMYVRIALSAWHILHTLPKRKSKAVAVSYLLRVCPQWEHTRSQRQ